LTFPTDSLTHHQLLLINIDVERFHDYVVTPFPNGLLAHDAQIVDFKALHPGRSPITKFVRKVDQQTISDFIFTLSNESWSSIFNMYDVNLMYNSFLNTYLRIYYASFPLMRVSSQTKHNRWITSCKRKLGTVFTKQITQQPNPKATL
jgi:hypothetical protein